MKKSILCILLLFPLSLFAQQEIDGYRVQVYSSNAQKTAKNEALEMEQKLKDNINQPIYVQWLSPFWKVRLGDFRTYDEAKEYKNQFILLYPEIAGDAYVVRDKINLQVTAKSDTPAQNNEANVLCHKVEKGEGLYKIAKDYDVPLSEILELNHQLKERGLQVGEIIKIPVKANKEEDPTTPQKITKPANLTYIEGSLQFVDSTGNLAIDANETCHIKLSIQNVGEGEARNCKTNVAISGTNRGIYTKPVSIPVIAPQQIVNLDIPIVSDIKTEEGNATFIIEVTEANGFGANPIKLSVMTKAFESPYLKIVDYSITSKGGTTLQKKQPFNLQLMIQNTQYGKAEDVEVLLKYPEGVFLMEGEQRTRCGALEGGKALSLDYELIVNNSYQSSQIPIQIQLKEKYGKYAEDRAINLQLNQSLSSTKLNVQAVEQHNRPQIQLATIGSDVDRNIPITNAKNPSTFVLIIANEHYQQVAAVPYALNDGNIFKEYCIKTLGVSEKHVHYIPDATINHIKAQVNWLSNITETWDDPQVIVYYAGHGIPDEASKTAYLLPVDGSGTDVSTGYKLDELYSTLGKMPASRITVFMDACFSGSKREDGMLASARGVALKAKSGVPQGNMVVFSAAQGDETAFPYREQQHGMFTYHLLKKLQETSGDVTLQELGNYIIREVKKRSLEENDKKQTPCVTPSATVGTDWENWKLK